MSCLYRQRPGPLLHPGPGSSLCMWNMTDTPAESTPPFPELNTGPLAPSPRTQPPKFTVLSPFPAWRLSDPIFMLFMAVYVAAGHPQSLSTISLSPGPLGFGTECLSACVHCYLESPACAVHVLVLSCLAKAGLWLNSSVRLDHTCLTVPQYVWRRPQNQNEGYRCNFRTLLKCTHYLAP